MAPRRETGEEQAQRILGTEHRAAIFKSSQVLDHLNKEMQDFIARQDMMFLATAAADGSCDCSFRAGMAGFVHILDSRTLAYPEYRGNGVWGSVGNIMENGHIGLLFLDFTRTTIGLHVNGQSRVLGRDEVLALPDVPTSMQEAAQASGGRRADAWVFVTVEEAYIHCSKHVPLMQQIEKHIVWGTDDDTAKGGNFFQTRRPKPSGDPSPSGDQTPSDR